MFSSVSKKKKCAKKQLNFYKFNGCHPWDQVIECRKISHLKIFFRLFFQQTFSFICSNFGSNSFPALHEIIILMCMVSARLELLYP